MNTIETIVNSVRHSIHSLDDLELIERACAARRPILEARRLPPRLIAGGRYEFRFRPNNTIKIGELRRLTQGGRIAQIVVGDHFYEVPKADITRDVTPKEEPAPVPEPEYA